VILTASSSALQNWLFQQKSKLSKESGNLDEQFGRMEEQLKAERSNLAEIADFKQLFKKAKNAAPKILRRRKSSQGEEEQKEEHSSDEEDQELDDQCLEEPRK
jgi:4-alpha-glucanotransferase